MRRVRVIGTRRTASISAPPLVRILSSRDRPAPAPKVHYPAPEHVKRREIPYWQEIGWRRNGKTYTGYYKTPYGTWQGRIEKGSGSKFDMFIINPPQQLKKHPHWPCFRAKGGGRYWLHFNQMPKSISDGILFMENILSEAFDSSSRNKYKPRTGSAIDFNEIADLMGLNTATRAPDRKYGFTSTLGGTKYKPKKHRDRSGLNTAKKVPQRTHSSTGGTEETAGCIGCIGCLFILFAIWLFICIIT